jgi:hypothetical protein
MPAGSGDEMSTDVAPKLPPSTPSVPPVATPVTPPPETRAGVVAYRSDQLRRRSVYRRANPLWRRALRTVIALSLLGALGIGLYFGARGVQRYLDRDRLPAAGAELPDIRSAAFVVTSGSPGPVLDGTLTVDFVSGAYEYVGRPDPLGPHFGVRLARRAGETPFALAGSEWQTVGGEHPVVVAVDTAISYLRQVVGPDDVLENRLRRGYVELDDRITEGADDAELTRYELTLNTEAYADEYPLQWQTYRDEVAPGLVEADAVPVIMVLDRESVVVRFSVPQSNWTWERVDYAEGEFNPGVTP